MYKQNYHIFVYGTLKRDKSAGHLLANSQYLGLGTTSDKYTLYGSDIYPGLVLEQNSSGVDGEIYCISENTKDILDRYEGVDYGLFRWTIVKIQNAYFLNDYKKLEESVIKGIIPIYSYIFCGNLNNFCKIKQWT